MTEKWITTKLGVAVCAISTAILWGSAYPGIKLAYQALGIGSQEVWSQILFAGCRFTLAGIMTLALSFLSKRRIALPTGKEFRSFLLLGFVMTYLAYLFFHVGLANTSGVQGAIWGSLSTFSTILFSHFLTRDDPLTLTRTLGCVLGFLGILLLNGGGGPSGFSLSGEGCLLLNAVCFGLGSVISKRVSYQKDAVFVSGYQLLLGGAGLLVTGLLGGGRFPHVDGSGILLILYLAFVSAGGFALWTSLLKYNPSSRVVIYHFLTPLFGAVFSAMALGEDLFNLRSLGALALVCLGVSVAERERQVKPD